MSPVILFDCDGVLVDSETLGTRVMLDLAGASGFHMPLDEAVDLLRGAAMAECVSTIEERLGYRLPTDFVADFRSRSARVFEDELEAIPGVVDLLLSLNQPSYVASNSPRVKVEHMLRLVGLEGVFPAHRIFVAEEISYAKPDPRFYRAIAARLGVAPADCVVVEDSAHGVTAAVGAGMRTFGYATGRRAADLAALGAYPVASMRALRTMLVSAPALALASVS